jgi:hypothetical protein
VEVISVLWIAHNKDIYFVIYKRKAGHAELIEHPPMKPEFGGLNPQTYKNFFGKKS